MSDFEGWPGVLGVFGRSKRGELKLAAANGAAELWPESDPALLPARAAAQTRAGACRS